MNKDIKMQNYTNEKAVENLKYNHIKKIEELKRIHNEGLKRGEKLRQKLEKQYQLNLYRNRAIMNSFGGDILSLSMRELIEKYDGDLSKFFADRAANTINKKLPPLPKSLISFRRRREFINEAKRSANEKQKK